MAKKLDRSVIITKIEDAAEKYKTDFDKYIIAEKLYKKSDNAGNELYDTLTDNFEKLFDKSESIDVSNKILEDFLTVLTEDSYTDVLLELYNNLPRDFNPILRDKLKIIEKKKDLSDFEDSDSCSYVSSDSVSINDIDHIESNRSSCRRSSRLQTRQNKYSKNIDDEKDYLEDGEKVYDYNDLDSNCYETSDNISIQKVVLDPSLQDKLESMLEVDLNAVSNIELDTKKIAEKVQEISNRLAISRRVIGPVVAKLSIGGYNDLITKKKCWSSLKERMQFSVKRLYAWIINKEAILFVHSLCPKKSHFLGTDKIILSRPSYFWLNCKNMPTDEVERELTPPIVSFDEEDTSCFGEFKPNVRVNKYIRSVDSDPTIREIFERTGKTYEFQNKNIILSNIKSMTTKNFKFKGYLDTVEICKEVRKHLTETNCSQRSFAENILGMSQGSASDLLTKPKKWEGLTRRGREPYVKMRAYLDVHLELKDQLRAILEEEEKEELEKLKILHKNKCGEQKKPFDEESLREVLNKFSEKPPSSMNESMTPELVRDDTPTMIGESQNGQSSILRRTEVLLQNKRNFKVVAKVTNPNQNSNNQTSNDNSTNNTFSTPFTESLNTMSLTFDMKTILDECKVSPAIFAERYMQMKPQDFHRLLISPRAWNLSPLEDRNAYEKMKVFLSNKECIRCLKERGLEAFSIIKRIIDNNYSPSQNNDRVVRIVKPTLSNESPSTSGNTKIIKLCVKRKPDQNPCYYIPNKKQRIYQNGTSSSDINYNRINECYEIEGVNKNQNENLNVNIQAPQLVPFDRPIPNSNLDNCIDKGGNTKIKIEIDDNNEVDYSNTVNSRPIINNESTLQIKEEIIENIPNVNNKIDKNDKNNKIQKNAVFEGLTNHANINVKIKKKLRDPKSFTILHEDCFKPIHKEEVNVYDDASCHAKFVKNDNIEELVINTSELEILYLAWTYNPNPQSVMKEYLSQMTVLPIETIESWYHKFNKLKGNYLRTADNSLTYRENLRKSVLTTTTRKKYLAVTDLIFKQIFSNKLAALINHQQ